jgi:predicted transposase YbfD/YdcC
LVPYQRSRTMIDQSIQSSSIMIHFSVLTDPRKPRNQLYSVYDLISTAILATLCSADDYYSFSLWAKTNLDWLQSVGICKEGAPSHDTYERFFKFLDPEIFRECFMGWTQTIAQSFGGVIAIDGKTLCNSGDASQDPIHMVSAFAAENSLILGQLKCKNKGQELETIQRLLKVLDIKGAIVTIDAAGCHKVVIEQIRSQGGDYLIALKGNQGNLHAEALNFFEQALLVTSEEANCDYWRSEEKSRGRHEIREVWVTDDLSWLPQKDDWLDLRSLMCLRLTKTVKDKQTQETRYYISNLKADAEKLGKAGRNHWSVENNLHWQLDVTYREDLSRVRKGNGAENLSVVRRATLNLLKEDKETKVGMKNRRLKAGWDRQYLLSLIGVN